MVGARRQRADQRPRIVYGEFLAGLGNDPVLILDRVTRLQVVAREHLVLDDLRSLEALKIDGEAERLVEAAVDREDGDRLPSSCSTADRSR